ncbi:helix-turn-helix domain-containing protein [Nocardia otitidiscaviarum]|uniref:helix-turn-helix domain-containing protein n=1 Tax=Nocardia otitidiscaviarum TaxID=1823 RepID=UPI00313B492F
MNNDQVWLSTEEVAIRLKVPKMTLAVWAAAQRGPRYAHMGRFRRYRLSDLLEWEDQQVRCGGGTRAPDISPAPQSPRRNRR